MNMQLVHLFTALAAFIAPVVSVPTTQAKAPRPQPDYWWNVTQWDAGCGTKACHYSFHVTAPKVGEYPGFKANCAGKDTGYFADCTIDWQTVPGSPMVSAKLKHQPDPTHPNGVALMGLSLRFLDEPNGYV